jgi:hypothetical protein
MRKLLLATLGTATALGLLATVAHAEPVTLTPSQMDELTAGAVVNGGSITVSLTISVMNSAETATETSGDGSADASASTTSTVDVSVDASTD